jgi:hypothetical protein
VPLYLRLTLLRRRQVAVKVVAKQRRVVALPPRVRTQQDPPSACGPSFTSSSSTRTKISRCAEGRGGGGVLVHDGGHTVVIVVVVVAVVVVAAAVAAAVGADEHLGVGSLACLLVKVRKRESELCRNDWPLACTHARTREHPTHAGIVVFIDCVTKCL